MNKNKIRYYPIFGFIVVVIILVIGVIASRSLVHPVINRSEFYFEGLGVIVGIIVPISFLVLISLIGNPQFKKLKYNKLATIVFSSILLFSLYLIIGAISINIFSNNITQAIYLLYSSVVVDAIVLTGLTFLAYLSLET